jgi:Calcineurin-like phosphoesterase
LGETHDTSPTFTMSRRIVRPDCPSSISRHFQVSFIWHIANLSSTSQVRAAVQLGFLSTIILLLVFILDDRYSVLPNSVHNAIPVHHPGLVITDITVQMCNNPLGSCKLKSEKWHRIDKDVFLGKAFMRWGYVHIQRKKQEELKAGDKVISDVRVGRLNPAKSEDAAADSKWESRPAGIWLKRTVWGKDRIDDHSITAVDLLFGPDAVEPRPGWEIKGTPLLVSGSGSNGIEEARLTVRKGEMIREHHKPPPRVNKNGKFKILQVSDLHLSTGVGHCRDAEPPSSVEKCEADPRTLEFVTRILDEEKPDLVVLSGDQVNGETAPDAQSAIFKYAQIFIERKIPFATIFGNHDDNEDTVRPLSRESQMQVIHSLPYSLSEPGPDDVAGVGNYIVEVLAPGSSAHSALTIYLLDTHSGSPDETHFKGYDWLKKSQIDWFKDTAQSLKGAHKAYSHIHLDMAFIHIPLPEYRNTKNAIVGAWKEAPMAPGFNSGFRDALVEEGIKVVSCGQYVPLAFLLSLLRFS